MQNLHISSAINLIQQIRLVHALTESKYTISLPILEESKLAEIT
jgi:hypothetical protein